MMGVQPARVRRFRIVIRVLLDGEESIQISERNKCTYNQSESLRVILENVLEPVWFISPLVRALNSMHPFVQGSAAAAWPSPSAESFESDLRRLPSIDSSGPDHECIQLWITTHKWRKLMEKGDLVNRVTARSHQCDELW